MPRRSVTGAARLAVGLVLAACAACTTSGGRGPPGPGEAGPGVITVGSFDFPESILLAYLYAGALSARSASYPTSAPGNWSSRPS
jgi:osmoprotectant transport system substrate-binding protein